MYDKERAKRYYQFHKAEIQERRKLKSREHKEWQRNYDRNLRKRVIQKLGGKCIYCGCDNEDALEINHIHGGGYKKRKIRSYKQFLLDIQAGRKNDVELTCRICNALHYLVMTKGFPNAWVIHYRKAEPG